MTSPPAETAWERRVRGGTVLACAAALSATWTFADPRPEGAPSPLALAVDVLLCTTAAVAIGGLVALGISRGISRGRDRDAVPRFGRLAIACAGILTAVGGYQVWRGAREFAWLLAGTLALAAVFAAVAMIRRAAGRQVLLLAAVLVLAGTATMVSVVPSQASHAQGAVAPIPAAVRQQAAPTRLAFDTGKPGGQGTLDLILLPGTGERGQVRLDVDVTVLDDTGKKRDDTALTAVFTPPDRRLPTVPVALARRADGHSPGLSSGAASIPEHGRWEFAITVKTADGGTRTVSQPIDVR